MTTDEDKLPAWQQSGTYQDISYDTADGIAKITICRPEVRNAFRPETLFESGPSLRGRPRMTLKWA